MAAKKNSVKLGGMEQDAINIDEDDADMVDEEADPEEALAMRSITNNHFLDNLL